MTSLPVWLEYPASGDRALKLKIKLPASWVELTTAKIVSFFVGSYNKKHPDTPLEVENVHLELRTGRVELGSDAIIKECIAADSKIIVRDGASRLQATIDAESGGAGGAGADGMLTCRNAGCQMKFKEEENSDTACCYHSGPPVFHETYKWWSCCPQTKATFWDDFMAIKGCCNGRHSIVKKGTGAAMGGQDVRAAVHGGAASSSAGATTSGGAPQRVNAPITAAKKIESLRLALVKSGVDGAAFDAANARLASADGATDDAVLAQLVALLQSSLV